MQKKIGTILDDKLLSEAKIFSRKEHITISSLIQQSLAEYLERNKHPASSFSAVDATFGALKISPQELKSILNEDQVGISR